MRVQCLEGGKRSVTPGHEIDRRFVQLQWVVVVGLKGVEGVHGVEGEESV